MTIMLIYKVNQPLHSDFISFVLQLLSIQKINDDLPIKLRKYHQFFKQDVRAGKGLISLAKKELDGGSMKTAFREYFVHYCPEYMQERGKVDFAISILQNKGELQ